MPGCSSWKWARPQWAMRKSPQSAPVALNLPCRLTAWCRATRGDVELAAACGVDAVISQCPSRPSSWGDEERPGLGHPTNRRAYSLRPKAISVCIARAQDASRSAPSFLARSPHRGKQGPTAFDWPIPWVFGIHFRPMPQFSACGPPPQIGIGIPRTQRSRDGNRQYSGRRVSGSCKRGCHSERLRRTRRECTAGGSGHGLAADTEQILRHPHPSIQRSFHAGCPCVGQAVADREPITGAGVFRHESGIHVRGLLADRQTYEPFAAESVGRRGTEIVLGKHSGTAAIRHALVEEGIHVGAAEAVDLLTQVRAAVCRAKCLPTPQELVGWNSEELIGRNPRSRRPFDCRFTKH